MVPEETSNKKRRIVVLVGGPSSEADISRQSGSEVAKALASLGHQVSSLELDNNLVENLKKIQPEVVFVALHGRPGEDGTVQGVLELLDLPYTGSGVLSSALAIDKLISKKIFRAEGLEIADYLVFSEVEWQKEPAKLKKEISDFGYPVVVKPVGQGSSVGVTLVKKGETLPEALAKAFFYDRVVIVEEWVDGREIQVGVLGNDEPFALPPIEIISKKEFFDFDAKYTPGLAEEITPAPISSQLSEMAQKAAVKAYQALGCRGFARVDMFLTKNDKFLISEINTIPGLTANSLFPKEAKVAGINFPELCQKLIDLAFEEHRKKLRPPRL